MSGTVIVIHPSDIIRKGLISILRAIPGIEVKAHTRFDGVDLKKNIRYLIIFDPLLIEDFQTFKKKHCQYIHEIPLHWELGLSDFSQSLCINSAEEEIRAKVRSILGLEDADSQINGPLSQREIDVLKCVAQGLANKAIADKLHISIHTVITHRKNITAKLGIRSASGLTVYAMMEGLMNDA